MVERDRARRAPGRPIYFVSSNSHSLANLLGGYARLHREEIVRFLRDRNFEDLAPRYDEAIAAGEHDLATNILYYFAPRVHPRR